MQTDPIGYADGMNWYNYVGGDPVNNVDPAGFAGTQSCAPNCAKNPFGITITGRRNRVQIVNAQSVLDRFGQGQRSGLEEVLRIMDERMALMKEEAKRDGDTGGALQNTQCPSVSPGGIGTMTEMQNAMSRPGWQTINAKRAADISQREAQARFPTEQLHNAPGDAWRHFRWNFSMAQSMGTRAASAYANAHEVSVPNDPAELAMDLYNNAMGRAFATDPATRNLNPNEAANLALRRGCLQTAP